MDVVLLVVVFLPSGMMLINVIVAVCVAPVDIVKIIEIVLGIRSAVIANLMKHPATAKSLDVSLFYFF